MNRLALVGIALLALVVNLGVARPASAGLFLEPEFGGRWVSVDWGDLDWGDIQAKGNILGPGITVGGTLGFMVTPVVALVAHADLGVHGAPEDLTLSYLGESVSGEFVDSGASLALLLGGRVYPMGGDTKAPFQPYLGMGLGIGSIAWSYTADGTDITGEETDGVGAFLVALEAGGDVKVTDLISLGLGGRYIFHKWASESVEEIDTSNLSGNSFNLVGHVGFHF